MDGAACSRNQALSTFYLQNHKESIPSMAQRKLSSYFGKKKLQPIPHNLLKTRCSLAVILVVQTSNKTGRVLLYAIKRCVLDSVVLTERFHVNHWNFKNQRYVIHILAKIGKLTRKVL